MQPYTQNSSTVSRVQKTVFKNPNHWVQMVKNPAQQFWGSIILGVDWISA